jgi:hypothetical protein
MHLEIGRIAYLCGDLCIVVVLAEGTVRIARWALGRGRDR